jgi:hypothetical protein
MRQVTQFNPLESIISTDVSLYFLKKQSLQHSADK